MKDTGFMQSLLATHRPGARLLFSALALSVCTLAYVRFWGGPPVTGHPIEVEREGPQQIDLAIGLVDTGSAANTIRDASVPAVVQAALPNRASLQADPILLPGLDELSRTNILARQGALRRFLAVMKGETTSNEEELVSAARGASQLSVFVIWDAEGRSLPMSTSPADQVGPSGSGASHRLVSGGRSYIIPYGTFTEYDRIRSLKAQFPMGIPVKELPLPEIITRTEVALRYSPQ